MNHYLKASRIHVLSPLLLGLSLSACSALGSFGGETFIFEGELPADFSLKAQAEYDVANECNGSWQIKTFQTNFEGTPQQYRFKIPVNYRSGLCEMQLAKVKLTINGRYGEKDWQQTYDNGGLVIVDKLPEGAPAFGGDGVLAKTAVCSWRFQLSKAKSRQGQISKLLNCRGGGAYLVSAELPSRTVRLIFQANPEEKPYRDNTWIKTSKGWKPCLPKDGWQQCQNPPVFKTFEMNDQECSVYPNCTE